MAKQKKQPKTELATDSPWPNRMAWALACTTFPLIWMGGLVTTYNAGMAVPDWPSTYGYNLFLYPLESWWKLLDVRLEHSHRLIGAAVGMLSIALAVLLLRYDRRRWIRVLGLVAVVGISLQGLLGGLRVIGSEIVLANIHGCTAPVLFAFCGSLVTFTSVTWRKVPQPKVHPAAKHMRRLSGLVVVAIYCQIVLGAQLRHIPAQAALGWFMLWVWLHLVFATVVLIDGVWLLVVVSRRAGSEAILVRRARLLVALLVVQILLGLTAWVTNYGWPVWFTENIWPVNYLIVAGGWWQAVMTTAHVGFGSLCLASAVSLAVWSRRLLRSE